MDATLLRQENLRNSIPRPYCCVIISQPRFRLPKPNAHGSTASALALVQRRCSATIKSGIA